MPTHTSAQPRKHLDSSSLKTAAAAIAMLLFSPTTVMGGINISESRPVVPQEGVRTDPVPAPMVMGQPLSPVGPQSQPGRDVPDDQPYTRQLQLKEQQAEQAEQVGQPERQIQPKPAQAPVARWAVVMPERTENLCMAGVCLGEPIDKLPHVSANEFGARVPGVWHRGWVDGSPDPSLDRLAKNSSNLATFQQMREIARVCSLASLPNPLTSRVRLAFTPDDGGLGGIEAVAEVLPKAHDDDVSTYAITQVRMRLSQGSADLSAEWVKQVADMWPGLAARKTPGVGALPEYVVMWTSSQSNIGSEKSVVRYWVDPVLSVEDVEFNRRQWEGRQVTHTLQWAHGTARMNAALGRQPGCGAPS